MATLRTLGTLTLGMATAPPIAAQTIAVDHDDIASRTGPAASSSPI